MKRCSFFYQKIVKALSFRGLQSLNQDRWVLVCGGSHAEIPLINALTSLGLLVVTSGNRPNDIGHRYANEYRYADFSDADSISTIAREFEVVGIVSACNDFAAIAAAEVAFRLNLPGHDKPNIARQVHHKDLHKQKLRELGISHPTSVEIEIDTYDPESIINLRFPLIVKPVDLTGGKGMAVCHDQTEVLDALRRVQEFSRSTRAVIEEYLSGTQHGVSLLLRGQKVVFKFFDDEQYGDNPFLVAGTTSPSSLTKDHEDYVVASVERLARHLELVDGIVHCQVITNEDGVFFLETCRRCPGDLYPTFVELATGFDYATSLIKPFIGEPIEVPARSTSQRLIARFCIMSEKPGVVLNVEPSDFMSSRIIEQVLWCKPGEMITNHLIEKLGIVFTGFEDLEELRFHADNFDKRYSVAMRE